MKLNIPIFLTIFRVILIPFFVITFYLPFDWAPFLTTLLFFIAGVTDWLDGYLARKWKQTTRFGAFLDPVADKIMVVAGLVLVVEYNHTFWITIPAIVVISREIIISAFKVKMSKFRDRGEKCATVQFYEETDERKRIFFTGSGVVISMLEKYEDKIPFITTVKKIDKYYTLT